MCSVCARTLLLAAQPPLASLAPLSLGGSNSCWHFIIDVKNAENECVSGTFRELAAKLQRPWIIRLRRRPRQRQRRRQRRQVRLEPLQVLLQLQLQLDVPHSERVDKLCTCHASTCQLSVAKCGIRGRNRASGGERGGSCDGKVVSKLGWANNCTSLAKLLGLAQWGGEQRERRVLPQSVDLKLQQ